MKAAGKALVADLTAVDPAHKADYDQGYAKFLDSLKPIDDKIAAMRKSYAGQPVTASEPVFGYQAGLIGLKVHNEKYALAIMNNAEPTPSECIGRRTPQLDALRLATTQRPSPYHMACDRRSGSQRAWIGR
jgi:zinc/manganese transport system substrate-binding protein